MNFEVIIGIEIHLELKTKTKMFSSSPVSFAQMPNTCVNEIDLGHPGVLPCVNKEAVACAIRACHAFGCTIDPLVKFDRKNYYYSDLPKGFQITQQFHPIGSNGFIEIDTEKGPKKIRLNRMHMEEDTAKQFHNTDETLIDFNRAGTPLLEIVSEADIRSGKEAAAYVEKMRSVLYYLGVSDVKMEEGSMRCDVNISLRPYGYEGFGTKAEIKNLNSVSNVQKAVEYEISRQTEILLNGGEIVQETRRYDEEKKATISMRKKEGSVDYKYFPEPNIFPILLDQAWIESIIENINELPTQRKERYLNYGLSEYDASVLVSNKHLSDFYDLVLEHTKEYKLAANWVITDVLAGLNKMNATIEDNTLNPKYLADMIEMIVKQEISSKQAKEVFEAILENQDPKVVVEKRGMKQVSDTGAIEKMIEEVLDENPQSVVDFKNGKDRAVGFIVGQVMKKSKGQANPAMTNKMVQEALLKR